MSRERAKAVIEEQGGKVTGSVSGKTSFVLVGDKPGGTKTRAAQKHEVPQIEEQELLRMIQDGEG
jgi:BRCT domain type II-containing protein